MSNFELTKLSFCKVQKRDSSAAECSGWLCSSAGWIISAGHLFVPDGQIYDANNGDEAQTASVQFPRCLSPLNAKLLYAAKDNQQGIDFAVLCLDAPLEGVRPLPVSVRPDSWAGRVRIVGIDYNIPNTVSSANGEIESSTLRLGFGNETFLRIQAENAVQRGYSGGPVFSELANAVIGIQVMASETGMGWHPNDGPLSVAGRCLVAAMPVLRMIECFPPLAEHLQVLERPFSYMDMLSLLKYYRTHENPQNGRRSFEGIAIEDIILPSIRQRSGRGEETEDLNQPILDAIERAGDRSCFILGEQGGCGKTFTLFKLFSQWMRRSEKVNGDKKIPIYVELRNLLASGAETNLRGMLLPEYLRNIFLAGSNEGREDLSRKIWQELSSPSLSGTRYALLLDGLNEVSLFHRPAVLDEILYWAQMSHIQVIITSRYKEDRLLESDTGRTANSYDYFSRRKKQPEASGMFSLLTIQRLKDDVIRSYLTRHQVQETIVGEAMKNQRLLDILCIPMYLTIFARLYLERPNSRLSEICTKGQLLDESFEIQRELFRKRGKNAGAHRASLYLTHPKESADSARKQFAFEYILPYIAFHLSMSAEHPMTIGIGELYALINRLFTPDSFMMQRANWGGNYGDIKNFTQWHPLSEGYPDNHDAAEWVVQFIVEELHIMRLIDGGSETPETEWRTGSLVYEFLHENLRDYFAALHIREDMACFIGAKNPDFNISLARQGIPHPVLEFLGDLCEEHEYHPFFDEVKGEWLTSNPQRKRSDSFVEETFQKLRGKHDVHSRIMVSNIIEVMKYSRRNDLSGADLRGLDFSDTWLGDIRFSRISGTQSFTASFDGATIQRSNLVRSGHDYPVVCVRRDVRNARIFYSADIAGKIMRWDLESGAGTDFCSLDIRIRDMVPSPSGDTLYVASEHILYSVRLSNGLVSRLYETKRFIRKLRASDTGLLFNTDASPIEWIELVLDEAGSVLSVKMPDNVTELWLCAFFAESQSSSWMITGGASKSHRVQVFHKKEDGTWNRNPVQTVPIPRGKGMTGITLSKDESRALFCIYHSLYEYSIENKKVEAETFSAYSAAGFGFADYYYNQDGEQMGIVYASGTDIFFLDNDYQKIAHFHAGNSKCRRSWPFTIEKGPYQRTGRYRFTRQGGTQRNVYEKYHLYVGLEIQEFDADTNICNRIFSLSNQALGCRMDNYEMCLLSSNMFAHYLKDFRGEPLLASDKVFVDYGEMKGAVSFSIQRLGRRVIVYDRYTDEKTSFKVYNGLFLQGCSMRGLEGEMSEPENQEILRRYGAIL